MAGTQQRLPSPFFATIGTEIYFGVVPELVEEELLELELLLSEV